MGPHVIGDHTHVGGFQPKKAGHEHWFIYGYPESTSPRGPSNIGVCSCGCLIYIQMYISIYKYQYIYIYMLLNIKSNSLCA